MKALYIDNYDSFAQMIGAHFQNAGCSVVMYKSDCSLSVIEKEKPDFIILGPGPNGPREAGNYLDVIHHAFHKELPIFGVCLGFQAIMEYFGTRIFPLKEIVHGASSKIEHDSKTIFEGIPKNASFARYHSLGTYTVPSCFEASAMAGNIVMAARHKNLLIEAVQFHPESILSMHNDNGVKLIRNVVRHYERHIGKNSHRK
ncbi:aminodeoxychorismate/anthranilate synthase component II [Candidatus Woesearchaeota archaeon]|nr:aminodeoxychorismate/anthranilate synthase component II [Candidatus Woesearchaeota archaeon]